MNIVWAPRVLIFIVFLLFSSFHVYSNTEEIKQRFKKLNELKNFEVSFKQIKTLKDLNFTIKSIGKLKVSKPNNVVWKITQPSYLEVNIESDKVTISSKEIDGTVQKQTYKYNEQSKNNQGYSSLLSLMSLLTMDTNLLIKEYEIVKKGQNKFLFTPKLKSDIFKNILIQLSADNLVKNVELYETSGDSIQINFQGYKINK